MVCETFRRLDVNTPAFRSNWCSVRTNSGLTVAQHGFYAKPRLRRWSIVWFAMFVRFVVAFWFATPWTPSLFVQVATLWYDIRDTYIVRFVADGCRKNLPLCGLTTVFFGINSHFVVGGEGLCQDCVNRVRFSKSKLVVLVTATGTLCCFKLPHML